MPKISHSSVYEVQSRRYLGRTADTGIPSRVETRKLKFEVHDMYGFISGITDTNDINYCPKCGAVIAAHHADGTARCLDCGFNFGVIECEEDEGD